MITVDRKATGAQTRSLFTSHYFGTPKVQLYVAYVWLVFSPNC